MTKNIKYACAPIAWTNDDMPELGKENSFEQCISEMALSGYEGTEIGNKYPKDPKELKKYLDPRGLSVASAWLSLYLTSKPFEETKISFIKHKYTIVFMFQRGSAYEHVFNNYIYPCGSRRGVICIFTKS